MLDHCTSTVENSKDKHTTKIVVKYSTLLAFCIYFVQLLRLWALRRSDKTPTTVASSPFGPRQHLAMGTTQQPLRVPVMIFHIAAAMLAISGRGQEPRRVIPVVWICVRFPFDIPDQWGWTMSLIPHCGAHTPRPSTNLFKTYE